MIYFIIFFILILIYMRVEASLIEVSYIDYSENKRNIKIIQLSDIHINLLAVSTKRIKHILDLEQPDIVLITGDYIEKNKNIHKFLKFMETIKGNYKIVMCFGNHDYKAFKDTQGIDKFEYEINKRGNFILRNTSFLYQKNSKKYNIIGIDEFKYKYHDIKKCLEIRIEDALNIAICHNPDIIFEIPKKSFNYLFCGHFHGGQIWMPFHMEFLLLRRERLCKMKITKGSHIINEIKLYINRGLGNVCFPLRFLSRPEITVFYLP